MNQLYELIESINYMECLYLMVTKPTPLLSCGPFPYVLGIQLLVTADDLGLNVGDSRYPCHSVYVKFSNGQGLEKSVCGRDITGHLFDGQGETIWIEHNSDRLEDNLAITIQGKCILFQLGFDDFYFPIPFARTPYWVLSCLVYSWFILAHLIDKQR